jgi:hypothetical protein
MAYTGTLQPTLKTSDGAVFNGAVRWELDNYRGATPISYTIDPVTGKVTLTLDDNLDYGESIETTILGRVYELASPYRKTPRSVLGSATLTNNRTPPPPPPPDPEQGSNQFGSVAWGPWPKYTSGTNQYTLMLYLSSLGHTGIGDSLIPLNTVNWQDNSGAGMDDESNLDRAGFWLDLFDVNGKPLVMPASPISPSAYPLFRNSTVSGYFYNATAPGLNLPSVEYSLSARTSKPTVSGQLIGNRVYFTFNSILNVGGLYGGNTNYVATVIAKLPSTLTMDLVIVYDWVYDSATEQGHYVYLPLEIKIGATWTFNWDVPGSPQYGGRFNIALTPLSVTQGSGLP